MMTGSRIIRLSATDLFSGTFNVPQSIFSPAATSTTQEPGSKKAREGAVCANATPGMVAATAKHSFSMFKAAPPVRRHRRDLRSMGQLKDR
ncbi:hypothetical protein [Brevundimonas sp. G8]|uniref:hypothetical protein n=1 Tax=Brevundimonas sp. G8 TaxID=1350776 RepID=UPI00135883B4|nr:hypothetical protein [Brevundimonas sp. G8]